MSRRGVSVVAVYLAASVACAAPTAASRVEIERLPAGGIQPQAIADAAGVVHIVYFTGDPAAGDIQYIRRMPDGRYSAPIRVNTTPGSAVAIASVRGAQIALGRDSRVHVVWNGSDRARVQGLQGMPLWYARQRVGGDSGFEPQRSLVTRGAGLDGGGTIAADAGGRIVAAWHSGEPGNDARGEVYLSQSTDDGVTFDGGHRIGTGNLGACACCSMRILIDRRGSQFLLYRAAQHNTGRDAILMSSSDGGATFSTRLTDPWKVEACELTSGFLAEGPRGVTAAWETHGEIRFSAMTDASPSIRVQAGTARRKHPVVVYNGAGESLLAWVEGTAWARGGLVAWQVYDSEGRATSASGGAPGVPVWGVAAAAALPDGRFLVIF